MNDVQEKKESEPVVNERKRPLQYQVDHRGVVLNVKVKSN